MCVSPKLTKLCEHARIRENKNFLNDSNELGKAGLHQKIALRKSDWSFDMGGWGNKIISRGASAPFPQINPVRVKARAPSSWYVSLFRSLALSLGLPTNSHAQVSIPLPFSLTCGLLPLSFLAFSHSHDPTPCAIVIKVQERTKILWRKVIYKKNTSVM